MARKKKSEGITFEVNLAKFALTKEKYIDQLSQFLEEHLSSSKVTKDGNSLKVTVPESFSKNMLKLRIDKYLYQAGLKENYRLVSLGKSELPGFQIMER